MHIKLAYGGDQVPIDVPDNWINGRCYRPHPMTACADVRAELMAALSELPEELSLGHVLEGKKGCLIAADGDNPVVLRELLPALIEMIEDESSLVASSMTILVANSLMEPLEKRDLQKHIDADTLKHCTVVLHDDASVVAPLGEASKGVKLTVNHLYKNAPAKIVLGGVRPDLIHGFTGGRAVLMPGLAGAVTLKGMYRASFANDRHSRYGNFLNNPFHITGVESANKAGCDLMINASITPEDEIQQVFAGHFLQSHMNAMTAVREGMSLKVKEPMDIVVTSGGGSPYDSTLMKIVATLDAVESVLKPDGTIVIAAALEEGIGPEDFERLVLNDMSVKEKLEALESKPHLSAAELCAHRFFRILQKHEVILFNTTIDEDQLWSAGLTPSRDINEAVLGAMESHGQRCKIVALPDGPRGIGEVGR